MSKAINELILNKTARYTEDHEWAIKEGEFVVVGISDYAQDQLGDIVYVELPEVDSEFSQGDEFGTVESTKAVSELYMPVGGRVIEINHSLEDAAELVNTDPYGRGWMIKIEPDNPIEFHDLMDYQAYMAMLKG